MKIAILQGAFLPVPPRMGGAVEKMWYLLGQKFAARGHDVAHVSRRWGNFQAHEWIQGVEHRRVAGYDTPSSLAVLKLLDGIYTLRAVSAIPKDADVIVTNTFWAPMLLPFLRRGKIYVDVARMPKGQMRFYPKAARLRANSTPVEEAIRGELRHESHGRVGMVPNPLPYDARDAVDLDSKERRILFCGRIHPEKGLELLQAAAHALPEGWRITIVGPWKTAEGGGGEAYLDSLKAGFASSRVEFVEPVYDIEKLNEIYRKAAIFAYPSVAEKGETFGLAPLEAMAWGCVPVVSDLACFKDFITHEGNGLIFDHRAPDAAEQARDCVLRLVADEAFRRQLAERALGVRTTHSADAIADRFLADFESICA